MATEERNSAEFQEKTALKRKLTGPPRLLLDKSWSPGQDERKSRKHRRHNDGGGGGGAPMDTSKDEQSSELHKQTTPDRPETVLTTECDGGTCMALREQCLETNLEQRVKKSRRKCKAGAAIRRIFSCGRRKKELGMNAVECNSIQDEELLTRSGDSVKKKKKPVKKIKMRMWCIFTKRSFTGKQEVEENKAGLWNDTFTDISLETSVDQRIPGAAEPPAGEDQQNESSGIDEDASRISAENCSALQQLKTETILFNADVNVDSVFVHEKEPHQHPSESHISNLVYENEPEIQFSELKLIEANSDPEHPTMPVEDSATDEVLTDVPVYKCKPLITIESVQSLDEENDGSFANAASRYGTLSPLVSLNGSCYALRTRDRRISEILLAQTALSLVQAAVRGAVEQLSDEPQSCHMEERDRV